MKIRYGCFVVLATCCLSATGQGLSLQGWGAAFKPPANCEVRWSAATNDLPRTLWVYKVVPSSYSPAFMSNALALGGYIKSEETKLPGSRFAKDVHYFQHGSESSGLSIVPRYGFVLYVNEKAQRLRRDQVEGVPSEKEALGLALEYLPKFGLDRSELATLPDSSELRTYAIVEEHGGFDPKEKDLVKKIRARAVSFVRRLDGVDFAGIGQYGGFKIGFGNYGTVAEMELVWPKLRRHEAYKVSNMEEIGRRITEGKAVIASGPNSGILSGNPTGIKKLIINRITVLYLGSGEDELREYIYPFATLEVTADMGHTNYSAVLNCPILTDKK